MGVYLLPSWPRWDVLPAARIVDLGLIDVCFELFHTIN